VREPVRRHSSRPPVRAPSIAPNVLIAPLPGGHTAGGGVKADLALGIDIGGTKIVGGALGARRPCGAEPAPGLGRESDPRMGKDVGVHLRLMTYNVRALRGDPDAVVRAIRAAAPDVVCLQEAPRFLRWRSHAAALARRAGLLVVTGGRPAGGNLLLSSLAVDLHASWDVRFSVEPGLHRRGAAVALLSRGGRRFAVAGTHLDVREGPRQRHIEELEQAIAALVPPATPTVVAGDMNARPGSATWAALSRTRIDVAAQAAARTGAVPADTSTAADPYQRIDGIFAGPGILVESCEAPRTADTARASDHLPVLAALRLPG
jgi:endonuclease/exonuclease/phosphatase family metal-dependent hydrolase